MAGTVDGVADRAVAVHQCKGLLQLGIAVAALFDRRRPEGTLLGRAAPIAEYDGQGHLALAEVIADVLAEVLDVAAIVERVVDELEGQTEIGAIGAERGTVG